MPYCKNCGVLIDSGCKCEKCKIEKRRAYQQEYYNKKNKFLRANLEYWEFRLGVKTEQMEKLKKEIDVLVENIKKLKELKK